MIIKREGYSIELEVDHDYNGVYVKEMLDNCDGAFSDAGFTKPERLMDGDIASDDGYQIMEGYHGGNFSHKEIFKGDELQSTDRRSYDLVVYGRHNDKAMVKILENINTVWDDTFYSAVVYGLDGELLDSLYGIHLDKPEGTKLEILEELSYMGLEIPELILKPRIKSKEEVIEYLKTYMPEYLLRQGSIKDHGWTINALTKKFDNPREELKSWLVDFYKEVSLQYAKLAWLKERIEGGELI